MQSTASTAKPKPAHIPPNRSGGVLNWPWNAARRPSAALIWTTRRLPLARLYRRVEKHIESLPRTGYGEPFVFVAEPQALPDNNAAERSLRPVVTSRKISGGTRSQQGTDTKMIRASIFGTRRAQALNPLTACGQLLAYPSTLNSYPGETGFDYRRPTGLQETMQLRIG